MCSRSLFLFLLKQKTQIIAGFVLSPLCALSVALPLHFCQDFLSEGKITALWSRFSYCKPVFLISSLERHLNDPNVSHFGHLINFLLARRSGTAPMTCSSERWCPTLSWRVMAPSSSIRLMKGQLALTCCWVSSKTSLHRGTISEWWSSQSHRWLTSCWDTLVKSPWSAWRSPPLPRLSTVLAGAKTTSTPHWGWCWRSTEPKRMEMSLYFLPHPRYEMFWFTVGFHLSVTSRTNAACNVFYRRSNVPVGSSREKVPGRGLS